MSELEYREEFDIRGAMLEAFKKADNGPVEKVARKKNIAGYSTVVGQLSQKGVYLIEYQFVKSELSEKSVLMPRTLHILVSCRGDYVMEEVYTFSQGAWICPSKLCTVLSNSTMSAGIVVRMNGKQGLAMLEMYTEYKSFSVEEGVPYLDTLVNNYDINHVYDLPLSEEEKNEHFNN